MLAVYNKDYHTIQKLVKYSTNVKYTTKRGVTALEVAVLSQDEKAVKLILDSGFTDKEQSSYFEDLLGVSARLENYKIIELLLNNGFGKRYGSQKVLLCFFNSINFGSIKVVRKFLENGINVNEAWKHDGEIPLMAAVDNGDIEKIKLLLNYGADPRIKNNNGENSFDYIKKIPPYIYTRKLAKEIKRHLKNAVKKLKEKENK